RASGIVIWDSDGKVLEPIESARERTRQMGSYFGVFIRPGKSVTGSVNLARWFDLTKTEQYTLQFQKKDRISGEIVKSNVLTLVVSPTESHESGCQP
ncbi:MAG TPA: hypothetical protein VGJ21_10315, partial [Terracidiphilus sp.]